MAQKKINISFPPAVALEMDEYCKQTDLSRSGLVTLAVTSYLEGRRVTSALNRLCDALEKIPSGELSEKDLLTWRTSSPESLCTQLTSSME